MHRVSYGEHILCAYVVCLSYLCYGYKEPIFLFIFVKFFKNNFIFVFNPPRVGGKNIEKYEFQSQIGGNCDWNSFSLAFPRYIYSIADFSVKVKCPDGKSQYQNPKLQINYNK